MSSIHVSVKTNYIAAQSTPQHYVYTYTITIANNGADAAQLISRRWRIIDANEQLQEVQGLGVVGEQPIIEPAKSYTYTSSVVLETETGLMEGTYQMCTLNGDTFAAEIPTFALVPPYAIH